MNDFKKIIYNCRKATYLIDKRLIGRITFRETVELRMHLFGCNVCRIYMCQSQKINEMIRQMLKSDHQPEIKLDENFKDALQVKIENQLNKN
ncbi:zf-HC2 domain-containing protein [Mucilaginibacter terrae]|uniref:zf-HC2 domain-containing protein n=1 Tax=Mucilaginibacter terrae TaxID=1955052 RepID=UPI003631AA99